MGRNPAVEIEDDGLTQEAGLYDEEPDCKYNSGVGCDTPLKCLGCGWNPKVSYQRLKEQGWV